MFDPVTDSYERLVACILFDDFDRFLKTLGDLDNQLHTYVREGMFEKHFYMSRSRYADVQTLDFWSENHPLVFAKALGREKFVTELEKRSDANIIGRADETVSRLANI